MEPFEEIRDAPPAWKAAFLLGVGATGTAAWLVSWALWLVAA